jgi:hypothetical protein
VVQECVAAVEMHRVFPPASTKLTVPVAPAGTPDAFRVEDDPYWTVAGDAATVIVEGADWVTAVVVPVELV